MGDHVAGMAGRDELDGLEAERGPQRPAVAPAEPVVAPTVALAVCTCRAVVLGTAEHAMDCPVRAAAQQLPASVVPGL